MYLIKSNNTFYLNRIYFVLNQIGIPITVHDEYFLYGDISFEFNTNFLSIKVNKIDHKFKLPIELNELVKVLLDTLQLFHIKLDQLQFNPIKETLSDDKKSIKLRNTHNLIIRQAVKHKEIGINKIDLYKTIWPKDVAIHLNKLDTHLTNLKNLLYEEFSYELKYKSLHGNLKFLIN